jgi:hypothetical protein
VSFFPVHAQLHSTCTQLKHGGGGWVPLGRAFALFVSLLVQQQQQQQLQNVCMGRAMAARSGVVAGGWV